MITLTDKDMLVHKCSWHENQDLNTHNAVLLAKDAMATRTKLIIEAVAIRLGRRPAPGEMLDHINERHEGNGIIWICWDDEAIAIRTEPKSRVKDFRYYLEWMWRNLDVEKN